MFSQPKSGYRRIACKEPCDVVLQDTPSRAFVWNLSVRGVYLVSLGRLRKGDNLMITFSLPDDPMPITCEARVAWVNPPSPFKGRGAVLPGLPAGYGLEFVVIHEDDKHRIAGHVEEMTSGYASAVGGG